MTTKELFENLLAGKKMKLKEWCIENHYIFLDSNGRLIENGYGANPFPKLSLEVCEETWQEYKEEILDKEEKAYLSAVIKPFRNRIKYISKTDKYTHDEENIFITIENSDSIWFPYFKKGTMYKGMELNKKYTLEELGL